MTLTEAKAHCRVDSTADDTLITSLIKGARQRAESRTNRSLITQTWQLYLDDFPKSVEALELPRPPVSSVTSVKYIATDGSTTTLSSTAYMTDFVSEPARVKLNEGLTWPTVKSGQINGVVVEYVAGYGSSGEDVPQGIRQGMLLDIGAWYENRESVVPGVSVTELPESLAAKHLFFDYLVPERHQS